VLRHRDAGDAEVRQHGASLLAGYRDGVLDRATVADGDVLLDVGTGDGLIGFAALDRVGPGGRLSIFEPINSFTVAQAGGDLFGVDMGPVADLAAKVRRAYRGVPADQDPMLNFDERDLLRWARVVGFAALELDYRAEVEVPEPLPTTDWEVLKKTAPNPLAPTVEEAVAHTLTSQERDRFEDHVRAVLAAGTPARKTLATAYLRAIRP
jgi:arsenite methyltransferase